MSRVIGYDEDFAAWARQQAELLREGRFDLLDIENLAEEVESIARQERRELEEMVQQLIFSLLVSRHRSEPRTERACLALRLRRKEIEERLDDSPSMRPLLSDEMWLQNTWTDAVLQASAEIGQEVTTFPPAPIWTAEQILDRDFFPNDADGQHV